jgi:hypothetical protein
MAPAVGCDSRGASGRIVADATVAAATASTDRGLGARLAAVTAPVRHVARTDAFGAIHLATLCGHDS